MNYSTANLQFNCPQAKRSCAVDRALQVNIHDVCIEVDGSKLYGQEQNMLHMSSLFASLGHVRDGSVLILRLNIAVPCITNPLLHLMRLLSGSFHSVLNDDIDLIWLIQLGIYGIS